MDLILDKAPEALVRQTTRHGPLVGADTTTFRLWAPSARAPNLLIKGQTPKPLTRATDGFWQLDVAEAGPGTRYKFAIGELVFPDLASRQQDGDATGWSVVRAPLPPSRRKTPLRPWHETLICEVHVGTASPEGTFAGLARRLEHFRDAGYTCLEIMPLNEFPGTRNWGYDGTLIFAPESAYGTPEELRALVDRAHALGLCMVLDVVYNHFGEVDNFAPKVAPEFFADDIETPWGPAVDFTQPMVRQFYYENARMWLEEFDFDGLRFDSVHEIGTEARDRFLIELAHVARTAKRHAKLILENMENTATWLERTPEDEPVLYAAQWNDDIHHVLTHLVTGEPKFGYDHPEKDPFADLEKALADGFVHDGEAPGPSDGTTRNEPASDLPPDAFITYVQNHDQIGNRADARRLADRISAEKLDFLYFVALLAPQIPLLFMGEEASLRTRFPFFIDFPEEAAEAKRRDRDQQMKEMFKEKLPPGGLPDPNATETFDMARLDWDGFSAPDAVAALARFRQLAQYRRDIVWPLTSSVCRAAHSARQENGLIITWVFEAGTYSMALNPQDKAIGLECKVDRPAAATGTHRVDGERLELGPWSAIVW
jgi:maltooligosyltrehalose trehalohydrolase